MWQVLAQWFDGRCCATAVVLRERHKHPAHALGTTPGAIVDVLALDDFLFCTRQAPICLAISHAGFVGTAKKIPIGNVEIDSLGAQCLVLLCDGAPHDPL